MILKISRTPRKCFVLKALLILLLFILPCLSYSQTSDLRVNPDQLNFKFLEHLIKIKVDSIRAENSLERLINDTILYLSSRDHARYLTRTEDLSHYQMGSRRKRTYHERAVRFGAEDYYVSENLGRMSLSEFAKNNSRVSYDQIANHIVNKWVASAGAMANILAPSHAIIGVASWYDKDQRELRLAASFATVTKFYKPHKNLDYFPYASVHLITFNADRYDRPPRRYEWGINPYPGKKILENYRRLSRRINTLSLITRNDSVFVVFNNVRRAETLFERRNDGLAVELIPHSHYSCDSFSRPPIRREEEFTVKGLLLPPVYKDELLENILNQKRKPRIEVKYIATIPNEYKHKRYSLNLVVLNRNRIADIITFNQTPEKVFDLALKISPAKDRLPNPDLYIPHLRRDTLKLRVFFDQNITTVDPRVGQTISDWVKDKEVQSAVVYAYASVEGTERINRRLSEQRGNEMIVFFSPSDGKTIPTIQVARENWFDFFRDIQGSRYQFLTSMDRAQIRNYVNEKRNSRELEPVLARQRFADLKILAYKVVNDLTVDELALSEYNDLFQKIKLECSGQSIPCNAPLNLVQRMELVQLFLFNRNATGRVNWNTLNSLPIAFNSGEFDMNAEPLAKLYYNKNRFILTSRGEYLTNTDSLRILRKLMEYPNPDPIVAYNYFVTLINSTQKPLFDHFYQQRTLSELQRTITMLEGIDFDNSILDQLRLYYHFKNAEQEYFINRLGDFEETIKSSLDFINKFFTQNSPPIGFAKDLSMFFSAFQMFDEAQLVLEPYAFGNNRDKEAFILYLKYYYANPRVKQNTDFYQFLKDAGDILTPSEWCGLFRGKWPIDIQVLDHEPLHKIGRAHV